MTSESNDRSIPWVLFVVNPAVTLGFRLMGKLDLPTAPGLPREHRTHEP
jgi:hypothetical protein